MFWFLLPSYIIIFKVFSGWVEHMNLVVLSSDFHRRSIIHSRRVAFDLELETRWACILAWSNRSIESRTWITLFLSGNRCSLIFIAGQSFLSRRVAFDLELKTRWVCILAWSNRPVESSTWITLFLSGNRCSLIFIAGQSFLSRRVAFDLELRTRWVCILVWSTRSQQTSVSALSLTSTMSSSSPRYSLNT